MKPTFTMMVGLPGSGKTTIAKRYIDSVYINLDAIRNELYGDESIQGKGEEVFELALSRIRQALNDGKNVVYDACNISSKRRRHLLNQLQSIDCQKDCVIVATSYDECLRRNHNRERQVPDYVITRFLHHFDTPYYFEGWDNIHIQYNNEMTVATVHTLLEEYESYSQDNPHHQETLGDHMQATGTFIAKQYEGQEEKPFSLIHAAFLHDCGKPYTKFFKDSKGQPSDVAHFFDHEHVGAYLSLFHIPNNLLASVLVNLHDRPYSWGDSEKAREKHRKLWGDDLFEQVMQLHQADKVNCFAYPPGIPVKVQGPFFTGLVDMYGAPINTDSVLEDCRTNTFSSICENEDHTSYEVLDSDGNKIPLTDTYLYYKVIDHKALYKETLDEKYMEKADDFDMEL